MSLTKSAARRRLSLFTGSSMAAASLLAAVSTVAVLAPTTALAANECGVQAGTAMIVCPPGTYPSGITYSTTANFNLSTGGTVDVSATGMDVIANGSNSVNLNTTAGAVNGSGGISVVGGTGTVTINAAAVTGGIVIDKLTGAITVVSTSGDIDVTRARPVADIGSVSGNVSLTGNGDIALFHTGSGSITANASGGSGLIHIVHSNTNRTNSNAGAVNATVGSGGLLLDVTGVAPEEAAGSGDGASSINGLTVQGSGAAEINIFRDAVLPVASGQYAGSVYIDRHFARLSGAVNLSGLSGGAALNVGGGGVWDVNSNATLSPGDDTVLIGEGGFLHTQIGSTNALETRIIDFGAGDDTLINEGRILVGVEVILYNNANPIDAYGGALNVPRDRYEAELVLEGLETFENRGEIWLGTSFAKDAVGYAGIFGDPDQVFYARGTDRVADDILSMPGTTFISGENGRIFMDINLAYLGAAQDRCDSSIRAANGDLPAADCINLQNGATEGTIVLSLTDTAIGGRGAYNPNGVVVIDMSDGAGGPGSGAGGEAGQVVLSPDMDFYNPNYGGVLDDGMFMYLPVYDAELKQFKIVGAPSGGAFHQPLIVNGAQQAWRSATAGYFTRQADLRDTLRAGDERTTGLWMRASYEKGERDAQHVFTVSTGDIAYNNKHDLNVASLIFGGDLVGSSDGEDYWVVGGMLGYVRTDLEYETWTDTASMNGMLVGAYGGLVEGPLFIDASVSGLWNRLDQDMPQAELFRDSQLQTDLNTLGVQAEAGWRFDLGMARVEPLVNASWSRTRPRDYKVPEGDPLGPGNQVMFEEATSTRAGVGLRGSTVLTSPSGMTTGFSLTGRYSKEFDGEASAAIGNLNPISPVVVDQFDGNFGELVAGMAVADPTGRLSGVLNVGTRFGDDYEAITAAAAFRYQW